MADIITITEVEKFNPYHDAKGRFASANGYASFTYAPGKSKAHDLAIAREKERQAERDKQEQSANSALVKPDEPVHIEATYRQGRNTMSGGSYMTREVLEARETKSGELELGYATPTKREQRKNGNIDYEFDLQHGVYAVSNSSGVSNSVGIDWDKVQTVSGKTYGARRFLEEQGFHYDSEKKIYSRQKPQAKVSDGKLVIPKGGGLPSDLSGVKSISGDTYANKDKIKAAGFKWDPAGKQWVRKGIEKAGTILLDDEPAPYDYIETI